MKTGVIYKYIAEDVEARIDTSNLTISSRDHYRKEIQLMKEFFGLGGKTCNYLIDNGSEDKKSKGTTKFVIKGEIKLKDYKNYLATAQVEKKRNHLEKNGTGGPGEDHQEFMKSNKLILKTQRGF